MAAVAIPLIVSGVEAIVPTVLPLVAKLMDKIFGSKTGATKLAVGASTAQSILTAFQKSLAANGVSLPTDLTEITNLLQATVTDLNSKGQLIGASTAIDPPTPNHALGLTLLDAATALLKGAP
jgi:hypothetical protein